MHRQLDIFEGRPREGNKLWRSDLLLSTHRFLSRVVIGGREVCPSPKTEAKQLNLDDVFLEMNMDGIERLVDEISKWEVVVQGSYKGALEGDEDANRHFVIGTTMLKDLKGTPNTGGNNDLKFEAGNALRLSGHVGELDLDVALSDANIRQVCGSTYREDIDLSSWYELYAESDIDQAWFEPSHL